MESFSNSDCIRSPVSSSPDIVCSSSGSSDTDIISRSRALHRVVTRLDFDSCVVQNSNACRQFRARVTRNVINLESGDSLLHPPEVTVLENNEGQKQVDVSFISPEVTVLENNEGQEQVDVSFISPEVSVLEHDKSQMQIDVTSINPQIELKEHPLSCSDRKVTKKLVHNFNMTNESELCLKSPDPILGTGSDKDITVSSPIIGRQNLSQRVRSFRHRIKRKKGRTKVNDALQPVVLCQEHTCLAVDANSSERQDSYQLNQETEMEVDLKNNMMLTAVSTDLSPVQDMTEMSPVASSQQNKISQSNVVSPVMKRCQRWRKRKHSVKISHLGKNCCDVVNKPDQSKLETNEDVLKDGSTEVNVSSVTQFLTPSSPVLGRSSEKRLRRAKVFMAAKSEDCVHDKAMQDFSVVSNKNGVLLCGSSIDNAQQQSNIYSNFDNDYPITLEADRQTEDDKGLKENQKCENYNVFGVSAKVSSTIKEDVMVLKELKLAEEKTGSVLCVSQYSVVAGVSVETSCNGIDFKKSIKPSSLEVGEVLIEDGQCGRKSVNAGSDISFPSNVLCRADSVLLMEREQKCNAAVKEENPDSVMSSEVVIETETSLEISMNNTPDHHHDVAQVDSCLR